MEYSLEIVNTETGGNGVLDFHVRVVADDGAGNVRHGPTEIRSIEVDALQRAYGGSYEAFLLKQKDDMIRRYKAMLEGAEQASGLVGKKL